MTKNRIALNELKAITGISFYSVFGFKKNEPLIVKVLISLARAMMVLGFLIVFNIVNFTL